ncbi:MAG: Na+/H+ antiporter NhaA [Bacteroidales bacterium]|nr:Na+/H+ antiporter NhaA [Candidatus Cacconaster merdequi]
METTSTLTPAQRYFTKFTQSQLSGGIVLLVCTIIALVFANSPSLSHIWDFWNKECGLFAGRFSMKMSVVEWVNDALMVVFFFTVGLEIKREMTVGQLSTVKKATLPVVAALGGMLFPALIYTVFNASDPVSSNGWGIPMATDIAFAIGILSLLGNRVPIGVKVLLTALAIADDLGAILVLAIFYPTHALDFAALGIALGIFVLLLLMNKAGVRKGFVYVLCGIVMWYFVLCSGIHATIAGVLLALTIPMRSSVSQKAFVERGQALINEFKTSSDGTDLLANDAQQHLIHAMSENMDEMEPLLHKFESNLQPVVNFVIMPLFALANAGVAIDSFSLSGGIPSIAPGIFFGLFCGKPLGIFVFSWLAVKLKLADLPANTCWKQIFAMGILGGIGFTMSIFIDNLAFSDQSFIDMGKVVILISSLVAAVVGLAVMYLFTRNTNQQNK